MTKDIITPVQELTDDFDAAFDEATADGESTLEASNVITAPQEESFEEEPSEEATPEEEEEQTDDDEDTSSEEEEGDSESASENLELKQLQALYEMERSRREQAERRYLTSEGRLRAANKQMDHKEESPKKITSAALKEFEEDYPDLVDPINELIAARLATAQAEVQRLIDEKVSPIANQVVQSSEQSHFDQISTAHPDWRQILDSGELDKWQASLNPVARVGVDYVRQNGTTAEIIEMFNTYKQDTGKTSVATRKSRTIKKEAPVESTGNLDVDDLVGKLKAALAVPSSRGAGPAIKPRDLDPDDFDAAFEEATRAA